MAIHASLAACVALALADLLTVLRAVGPGTWVCIEVGATPNRRDRGFK